MPAKNWTILYGNWQRKNNTMRNCRRCKGSSKDSRAGQTTCRIARPLIVLRQFLRYPVRGGGARYEPAGTSTRGRVRVARPVCVGQGAFESVSNEPGAVSDRITATGLWRWKTYFLESISPRDRGCTGY